MVRERVDEAYDGDQHHSQEQGIHPVAVPVARLGFRGHGLRGPKKDYEVTAAGGGQNTNTPSS